MMFKISVGRDPKNPTTSSVAQIQLSIDSFSKSSNSQDLLSRAWRHPHSSPISFLGFIMTMVIAVSFAHERKTVPKDYAPELLTQIVQGPTKLNDKILLTRKDLYKKKSFLKYITAIQHYVLDSSLCLSKGVSSWCNG